MPHCRKPLHWQIGRVVRALAQVAKRNSCYGEEPDVLGSESSSVPSILQHSSFVKLVETMDREGIRAGLAFLNSLTDYRFTSLYRFDREILHGLFFFDRQNPACESSDDVPIISSYCVFVRNTGNPFATQDSLNDPHVRDHPKRLTIQAYCGVPLLDRDGKMFGTVCHYDVKPVPADPDQIDLLEKVADVLRHRLPSAR